MRRPLSGECLRKLHQPSIQDLHPGIVSVGFKMKIESCQADFTSGNMRTCFTTRLCLVALAIFGIWSLLAGPAAQANDAAVIVNSGSTNVAGFQITVERLGDAELAPVPRRPSPPSSAKAEPTHKRVPGALVGRFYSDLEAAKPLSSLPKQRCFKSASFGSKLTIEFGADETPDLSCGDGGNLKLRALIQDTNEIVNLFTR